MTLAPLTSSDRDQSIEARRAVEAAQAETEPLGSVCSDSNSC